MQPTFDLNFSKRVTSSSSKFLIFCVFEEFWAPRKGHISRIFVTTKQEKVVLLLSLWPLLWRTVYLTLEEIS